MTHREEIKHYSRRKCWVLVLLSLCLAFRASDAEYAGLVSAVSSVNCSSYCSCQFRDLQHELERRFDIHNSVIRSKYGDSFNSGQRFTGFLGFFSMVVRNLIVITCEIGDGRSHSVSSLLNGIENIKYTSLSVTCSNSEELTWDIPSWEISFNIFESKKCNLLSAEARAIVLPMNMWMFEVISVGDNFMEKVNTRYATNTILLSIEGTDTHNVPDRWSGDSLISLERLSLPSNKMKRFDCKIMFTRDLDLVNLNNNELVKIPDCLLTGSNAVNIRVLLLSNNEISDISNIFSIETFQSNVECLDLSFNLIESIGTFRRMADLFVIDLSNNQISQINDDAFNQLHKLRVLYLQNNRIHYVGPVAFRANVDLNVLKLSNNLLKFLQGDQFPQSELQIDIRKNRLRVPPFITDIKKGEFPSNIRLFASNNVYHCDCHMIKFEEFLDNMGEVWQNRSTKDRFIDLNQMKCATPRTNKGKYIASSSFSKSCPILENCPGSCECVLTNKRHFIVNCTGRRLLEMPESIPIYTSGRIVLDLSNNPLQLLGHRSYLVNLSELRMDNCLMTSISPKAIVALQDVQILTLHNNLLQKLPVMMKNVTLKRASNITLHNNRWACTCDSLWLPSWISAHRSAIWMPSKVLCNYLKKPVEEFTDADVSCESFSNKDIFFGLSMIVSSIISTFLLFFYFTKEIRLFLYTNLGIRLCTDFSYGDVFSPYDAFISYGQDNYKWVVDTLVPYLEDGPKKYKLCLHYRDFPNNEPKVENIPWAIRLSKCSILVVSKDFMKKEWCILELRAMFQRLLMAANRLIVIITDDLTPGDLTADLREYLNTHEYLRVGEDRFWEKLDMFLPPWEDQNKFFAQPTESRSPENDSGEVVVYEECANVQYCEEYPENTLSFTRSQQHYEGGDHISDGYIG